MKIALAQLSASPDRSCQPGSRALEAMDRRNAEGAQLIAFPELAIDRFFPQYENANEAALAAEPIPGPTTDRHCREGEGTWAGYGVQHVRMRNRNGPLLRLLTRHRRRRFPARRDPHGPHHRLRLVPRAGLLSIAIVRGLVAIGPETVPRLAEVSVDFTALGYAVLVALICGLVFGSAPAFLASRTGLGEAIKDEGRGSMSPRARRALHGLVTVQVAMAVVLVLGASLLVNSFLRLSAVRPGFDTEHSLVFRVELASERYPAPENVEAFYQDVRQRLGERPGIETVGFSTHLPFAGPTISASYLYEATGGERVESTGLDLEVVGEGYFESLGIPMLLGRDVARGDRDGAELVAVINQAMAETHWPGASAIGRRLTLDGDRDDAWHTVVGVVGSTLKRGLDDTKRPIAYFPRQQFQATYGFMSGRTGYLAIRTTSAPSTVVPAVRSAIATVDPTLPLSNLRTSADLVSETMATPRFRTLLVGSFAGLALLVALIGVYGVMSFAVARRTREIGIRMSLGATDARIMAGVLRSGLGVVGIGLGIGIAGGVAASRTLSATLFGVTPTDPTTYVAAGVFVAVAGLAASYVPARRASRVEPMVALREE